MTNGDKIRSMGDEEIAKWLCNISDCGSGKCPARGYCVWGYGQGMIDFIKSEESKEE